jgi:hypothetical protein
MKPFRLSRRACLRGLGVSLALPGLEAMAPSPARAQPSALRFLCIFSPNGFLMNKWTPAGTGTGWATPPLLAALEPFRPDFNIISGLGNYTASIASRFGGSHTRATGSLLTQCPIAFSSGSGVRNGISLDQIIANRLGDQTRFPSLQLGSRAGSLTGDCEDGYSCAYQNNISWSGPTTPLPKQVNPRDIFNRLFGDGAAPSAQRPERKAIYGKSILDLVSARATTLRARLGRTDRTKLDEYLSSVREVEQRLERAPLGLPGGSPACAPGAPPRDAGQGAIPFPEHLDLLSDLIALALQCDLTRVVTYMFEHAFSDVRSFSFLPGVTGRHHAITHSNQLVQEEKIDRFYVDRVAYLLGKLKAIREGDRTLLDNSIVYFTSEFGNGHEHDHRQLAMLVAGKAGGRWKTGLHLDYPLDPGPATGPDGVGNPNDTQLAHLHLTTLHAFGIDQATFGQDDKGNPVATRPLSELLA